MALADPEPKELVITDPGREAMPVIRYLDRRPGRGARRRARVPVAAWRCASGGSSAWTGGIPRVKGMFVVPKHVGDVLERCRLKTRYQLRIERPAGQDALTVVLARPEEGLGDVEALKEQLAAALRIRAEIEEVDSLPDDAPLVDDRRAIA